MHGGKDHDMTPRVRPARRDPADNAASGGEPDAPTDAATGQPKTRQRESLEQEAEVKRKLLMDYGKLSPDERRAEALARFAEHGHLVDPSTVTCTADEWLPSLLLPDGRTIVYHVDPSATTTDLIAEAARLMQRPAADIRLLDRDGDRLGTAGGVHSRVTRAASGTVSRRPVAWRSRAPAAPNTSLPAAEKDNS